MGPVTQVIEGGGGRGEGGKGWVVCGGGGSKCECLWGARQGGGGGEE
jgi:hypothetical protein